MKNEQATTHETVTKKVYAWNERKKQFSPRQIDVAMNVLLKKGWV